MSLTIPPTKNYIPLPIQSISPRELFILTGLSLDLLKGFKDGKFRPNYSDRVRLSNASMQFYGFSKNLAHAFLLRAKFRLVRYFISAYEKNELLSDSEKYEKRLEVLFEKHWDKIVVFVTEKFAS